MEGVFLPAVRPLRWGLFPSVASSRTYLRTEMCFKQHNYCWFRRESVGVPIYDNFGGERFALHDKVDSGR